MTKATSILDKTLSRGKNEVNLSTFAVMFSEMVRYAQNRTNTMTELQDRLSSYGKFVGVRMLDVIVLREKGYKRETKLLGMLMFIKGTVWKNLFNKEADRLERSNEHDHIYMLVEKEPMVNTFISVPRERSNLNCAAFTAGIIEAMLEAANFPCKVEALSHEGATYYRIEFEEHVIKRENSFM